MCDDLGDGFESEIQYPRISVLGQNNKALPTESSALVSAQTKPSVNMF